MIGMTSKTSGTDYSINYDDEQFKKVESDKQNAIGEMEKTYSGMIEDSDGYYQAQINASKEWEKKQTELQNEKTDFAIREINQQKDQAKKDYTKEQSGAYVDWQKQSNEFGTEAEARAAQGMANTGFSESSQVSMYNTYQSRVATAREAYNRAVLNYDNAITEARLQNNSALAQIAFESLQQQLELSLQGFQYKNTLVLEKANKKTELEQMYHERWQDVLQQMNTENALAEQIREFNASQAMEQAQFAESVRQFHILNQDKVSKYYGTSSGSSSSSSGSGTISARTAQANQSNRDIQDGGGDSLTYTDVAHTAAQLKASGASKQEINTYINEATSSSNYKATTSTSQDTTELKSSYVGHGGR